MNPSFRNSQAGGTPGPSIQDVALKKHWIPDIAVRFRDDEQASSRANRRQTPRQVRCFIPLFHA